MAVWKLLKMVDLVEIEPADLFHVMEMPSAPVGDGKGLTGRNSLQNRQNCRYLLPICYQIYDWVNG